MMRTTDMTASTRATAIREYVDAHRDEMLALLQELVEIESPTAHPEGTNAVAGRLGSELTALGFDVRRLTSTRFGDHLVADGGSDAGPPIFAIGHVDTVYDLGTGWGFSRDSERAYGPGVIDMKSGNVSLVFALRALHATGGIPLPVRVCFNTDEEPGSPESRHLFEELLDGYRYALVLEPTEPSGEGVGSRKGVGIFTIEVTGRAAHAGQEPEKGASANAPLCRLVLEAEALARPDIGTTVNAGWLRGGTAAYVIPESAEARIDVRVPDTAEQRRIETALAEICAGAQPEGVRVELSGGFHRPPMERLPEAERLHAAWGRAADLLGQEVTFGLSGAASDGNSIAGHGVPVIDGLGPVGGRAHSSEEYLEIETFFDRTALLAVAIADLSTDR